MKAMHTPGPWIAEFGESYIVRAQQDGGRVAIMTNLKGQFGMSGRRSGDEVASNARLIAAAPDLLDALLLCEGNISSLAASHPVIYTEWLSVVRSAIAKAEGR